MASNKDSANKIYSQIIIGAGFAGIGMGIRLLQKNKKDFIILERNPEVGGTWYDNQYPGAACDVQSHLYCYSFAPNPNWSRVYSPQKEILSYIKYCVDKYNLSPYISLGKEIVFARWHEEEKLWELKSKDQISYWGKQLISCSGGLSQPFIPDIKGKKDFQKLQVHSAQWPDNIDLKGKKVGIIGTGASAIQIIPAIQSEVKELHVFQRTAAWVVEKQDRNVTSFEKWLFKNLPVFMFYLRIFYYWKNELGAIAFLRYTKLMKFMERKAIKLMRKSISDNQKIKDLTPDYTMGCKRILLSNEFYPAMAKENVFLHKEQIRGLGEDQIQLESKNIDLDLLIWATGFKVGESSIAFDIIGQKGVKLNDVWSQGAEAYKGTSINGFPNLFLIIGPNTGLGHSSIILMIEAQIHYIMEAIGYMEKHQYSKLVVNALDQKKYNLNLQHKLNKTVWQSGGCKSWYQNKEGKNVALWPGYTFEFMRMLQRFDASAYEFQS
jgi:cation diffusion facilitator CzcD-associated flavoprotein CzcO